MSALDTSIELLKQVGFPIFVAGWFMLRMEKRLDRLTEAVLDRRRLPERNE